MAGFNAPRGGWFIAPPDTLEEAVVGIHSALLSRECGAWQGLQAHVGFVASSQGGKIKGAPRGFNVNEKYLEHFRTRAKKTFSEVAAIAEMYYGTLASATSGGGMVYTLHELSQAEGIEVVLNLAGAARAARGITLLKKGNVGVTVTKEAAEAYQNLSEAKKSATLSELKRAEGADDVRRVVNGLAPSAGTTSQASRLSWNEFRAQVGGHGYSQKQISRLYKKYLASKGVDLTQLSKRLKYLGPTPGKDSATGRAVIARMRGEGRVKDTAAGTFVKDASGTWYPLDEMDMGHITDAVRYWNTTGIRHGAKSPAVRKWMLDPKNYELQHFSRNRSAGARLGETYIDP